MNKITTLLLLIASVTINAQSSHTGMRGITGLEITAEMAPGLNLYNTLDAYGDWISGLDTETCWGKPFTTFEMVESMANRGFKTLRIPVTWKQHLGPAPDYFVDEEWMDRVEEVVNYALDNGMYAIINIHHDDEHIVPTYAMQEESTDWLEKVWTQISTRFKDYGDYLIFETLNEPRAMGTPEEWTGGSAEHREVVNAFNLAAVDIIRATGGNNESRFIMIPQVGANPYPAMEDLIIPNNDTSIIVSVHGYNPYWFCLDPNGSNVWGSPSDIASLQNDIKAIADKFVAKGQAVVMGEWGAGDKDNYMDRIKYYNVHTKACKEGGITPVIWIFGFDRENLTWTAPLIEEAILQVYDTNYIAVENIILNKITDTLYIGEELQLTATIIPDTAFIQDLAWGSNNKRIASVSSSGLVEAKGEGETTIKAGTIDIIVECNIVVLDTLKRMQFSYEAEDYKNQAGIQTETCSDTGGGMNVGYIQNGDWCSYKIRVDSAGVYDFTARAASETNGGTISVSVNNKAEGEVQVDGSETSGWQDWYTTESAEVKLEKGSYDLKLTFKGGGGYLFNLNWIGFNFNRPLSTSLIANNYTEDVKIYPNPATNRLNLKVPTLHSQIELYSIDGKRIMQFQNSATETELNVSDFNSGIYILKIINGRDNITRKIMINN